MSSTDYVKAVAMQTSMQTSPQTDPTIDMMLQSLMIDDTNIKQILKGEIQQPLNQFKELVQNLNSLLIECFKNKQISTTEINRLLVVLQEFKPVLATIEKRLARYYHNVPYLLMLSPLVRLSNIDRKQADAICRKVGIMIGRDKLMSVGDEGSFEDLNFYDAIFTLIYLAVHESVEGWKMKEVTEEKKTVQTVIQDRTGQVRKKRFGIF